MHPAWGSLASHHGGSWQAFPLSPAFPGSLFSLHWCLATSVLTLTFAWALLWPLPPSSHQWGCLTARDHCPQHSTAVCPPHSVTLYAIIPSVPAETSPSDHFPAQETTLPPITHGFYWSFISPSALLQVILSLPGSQQQSLLLFWVLLPFTSTAVEVGTTPEIRDKLLTRIHGLLPRVSIFPTVKWLHQKNFTFSNSASTLTLFDWFVFTFTSIYIIFFFLYLLNLFSMVLWYSLFTFESWVPGSLFLYHHSSLSIHSKCPPPWLNFET